MSIAVMEWARSQTLSHTRAAVLKELANRANDNGLCWPSLSTLANDARLCRRTVIRCLNDLEQAGLIIKVARQGHSTVYQLQLAASMAAAPPTVAEPVADLGPVFELIAMGDVISQALPVPEAGPVPKLGVVTQSHPPVTESHPPGDTESPPGVTQSHPEPKVETKGKPKGNVSARELYSPEPIKTPLPVEFALSDRVRNWAAREGFDQLQAHFEAFREKAAARGYTYADWDQALMNAIRGDWAGLRKQGRQSSGNGSMSGPRNVIDFCDYQSAPSRQPASLGTDQQRAEYERLAKERHLAELQALEAAVIARREARLRA